NFQIDNFCSQRLQGIECTSLILAHKPAVSDHVGSKDSCKPSLHRNSPWLASITPMLFRQGSKGERSNGVKPGVYRGHLRKERLETVLALAAGPPSMSSSGPTATWQW